MVTMMMVADHWHDDSYGDDYDNDSSNNEHNDKNVCHLVRQNILLLCAK